MTERSEKIMIEISDIVDGLELQPAIVEAFRLPIGIKVMKEMFEPDVPINEERQRSINGRA